MYDYNKENKTLTINNREDVRNLPEKIRKEVEYFICNEKETAFEDDEDMEDENMGLFAEKFRLEDMPHLKNVIICEENPDYQSIDGIVYSKDGEKLIFCPPEKKHVTIQDGTKVISVEAFAYSQISEITIPNSVETIDEFALFSDNLTQIHFLPGSQLKNIGNGSFIGSKLEKFEFPPSVEFVGEELFNDCPVKEIYIPQELLKKQGCLRFFTCCIDYSCDSIKTQSPAAIIVKPEGYNPVVVPRYVKWKNFKNIEADIQAFLSQKDETAPDLHKYGYYDESKEDTAILQYQLYQSKSSKRVLTMMAKSICERKADEGEKELFNFVALDDWSLDMLQYMLNIAQERNYTTVIAHILEKLAEEKNQK